MNELCPKIPIEELEHRRLKPVKLDPMRRSMQDLAHPPASF